MIGYKKKHIISGEEALQLSAKLMPCLLQGNFKGFVEYLDKKIETLGLSEAQQHNLKKAYSSIADSETDLEKRILEMSPFFDGDEHAALAYCVIENMRWARM